MTRLELLKACQILHAKMAGVSQDSPAWRQMRRVLYLHRICLACLDGAVSQLPTAVKPVV
jgi:hypothetical protein